MLNAEAQEAFERWKSTEEGKWKAEVDKAYQKGRESILFEIERDWHTRIKKLVLNPS